MYLVENINNFNINNVYFSSSLENTVIDEGTFSKLIYSTSDVVINGIYLLCSFSNTTVEKIAYNKFKISWNKDKNAALIEAMKMIEHKIMVKYGKKNYSNHLISLHMEIKLSKFYRKYKSLINITIISFFFSLITMLLTNSNNLYLLYFSIPTTVISLIGIYFIIYNYKDEVNNVKSIKERERKQKIKDKEIEIFKYS